MFMWHHNSDLITYKSSDGPVKYSYPQLKEKFEIADNYSLMIFDVGAREAGNYTCKKIIMEADPGGGVSMKENMTTKELIVQG